MAGPRRPANAQRLEIDGRLSLKAGISVVTPEPVISALVVSVRLFSWGREVAPFQE